MNKLPGVFAPSGSGVTQPELDKALQNLIIDKIHTEVPTLKALSGCILELADTIENNDAFEPFMSAAHLKELEKYRDVIEATRYRLSERFEALQRDRERCAAEFVATEPLSLSA